MEVLIILVIFGICSSTVAASKNRSALGWFVIGFLFHVVGLIVALVIDPPRELQAAYCEMAMPSMPQAPSKLDDLERLATLHTQGVLSDAEFQAEKARVLARLGD